MLNEDTDDFHLKEFVKNHTFFSIEHHEWLVYQRRLKDIIRTNLVQRLITGRPAISLLPYSPVFARRK